MSNNLSLSSNYSQNISSPELQKKLQSEENFGALDKEKLKQDTVELSKKAQKEVKENWLFRTIRNTFGIEPKKFFISLGLTAATVVGGAVLGNKLAAGSVKTGIKFDEALAKNSVYKAISGGFSQAKNGVVNFLRKSKTIDNIFETLKNRKAKAKLDLTRGYGRGFVSIFSLTPVDILEKAFKKQGLYNGDKLDVDKAAKLLENLVGDNTKAKELIQDFVAKGRDNREFCQKLSAAMREKLSCKGDNAKFLDELTKMRDSNGAFVNVDMVDRNIGGIASSWWPVNIINSIGKKLGFKKQFCRGNLYDSLIKFNAVDGAFAKTKLGSLVQKSIIVPTESITNFVNDKSGMGFFLCLPIMNLYNNVQDAPKSKRAATVADDYLGTIGSIAISTPMAFATTYGLASLRNLQTGKGKGIFARPLKWLGNFFGMGLDKIAKDGTITHVKNPITRGAGGFLRFAMVMFVFGGMFSKPIKKVINKVFGKPYDKAEEEQKKQLEEQKNMVIPELGITQGQLMEKIQKNPNALQKIQSDAKLMEQIKANPKALLDILDGKEPETKPKTAANASISPVTKDLINKKRQTPQMQNTNDNAVDNKTELFGRNKEEEKSAKNIDSATYIPSSEFSASTSTLSPEENAQYQSLMTQADKALKNAEKYI